jgi:hypothetical protein
MAGQPFTELEVRQLRWLTQEQHTPFSASYVIDRAPRVLLEKARKIGFPFARMGEGNRRGFHVSLPQETFAALISVGNEISLPPPRLARIVLTIVARRNLWAEVLDLQRDYRETPD